MTWFPLVSNRIWSTAISKCYIYWNKTSINESVHSSIQKIKQLVGCSLGGGGGGGSCRFNIRRVTMLKRGHVTRAVLNYTLGGDPKTI